MAMTKKMFALIFFISTHVFGQNEELTILNKDNKDEKLSKNDIKPLMNNIFSNLIGPQTNNIIGNFSTIDLALGEVNLAGNVIFDNGSILGIKASGKSTNGILPIFSNSDFNSKVGINVQYNLFTLRKWQSISYTHQSFLNFRKKIRTINYELENKNLEINADGEKINLNQEIIKRNEEIKDKKKLIDKIDSLYKVSISPTEKEELILKKEKLLLEILILENKNKQTLSEIEKIPSKAAQTSIVGNDATEKKKEALKELRIEGFSIFWISLGYGISNNSFRIIQPSELFENQIVKTNFLKNEVNIQINYFKLSPFKNNSIFISGGINYSIDDNFNSLKKTDVEETKNIGPNPGDREIVNKYVAYQGEYISNLNRWSLTSDFFYFLFKDNQAALHIFPKYSFGTSLNPYTNLGLGFLWGIPKKGEATNIVNAELFVDLFDVNNRNNSELKLIDRSTIGLRFTFPFNFKLKK
ncbi:hypothetical protein M3O96_20435 [Aquiflexum sp. TKW24L]|uniref:hypothetical protein n=1 Tax=Aquiflexum sp. TKW24L TaxID=2942212 RepID=UPI0020C11811|nr:hypothetical protein [Aquiflexum sp. TKW24L]MCL6261479.1 hypothetical protein [Aquiflexum sp. TKW24L]